MKYCIVYNLHFDERLGTWFPSAFIVELDEDGKLRYMDRVANMDTLSTFGNELNQTDHVKLIALCQELQYENIELKFTKSSKKKTTLKDLLADQKLKIHIFKWLDQKKEEFFRKLIQADFIICKEIKRKVLVENLRLHSHLKPVEPKLFFKKTADGLDYSLQLDFEGKYINPMDCSIELLSNDPGWILKKNHLYRLEKLNALKLLPFLQKPIIQIPKHLTKTYFEKFIVELIGKVDAEVEGFEVIQEHEIKKAFIQSSYDFIKSVWMIELYFDYGAVVFNYADPRTKRTKLSVDESGEVSVQQKIRSLQSEDAMAKVLVRLGLALESNKRFYIDGGPYAVFEWLIRHKAELSKEIEVPFQKVDEMELVLEEAGISLSTEPGKDWFDVKGVISIGEVSIPFSSLIKNIRSGERFYPMKDGRFFLIPEEWFSTYHDLAVYGEDGEDYVRMPKSHFNRFSETEAERVDVSAVNHVSSNKIQTLPAGLQATLRPYQMDGYRWLVEHYEQGLGACLADDMGLGKTLQTLAALFYAREQSKSIKRTEKIKGQPRDLFNNFSEAEDDQDFLALIVLPTSLVFNWKNEIKRFCPTLKVLEYIGTDRFQSVKHFSQYDLILTSYGVAIRDYNLLQSIQFDYIVLDESQRIKNRGSKAFKLLFGLHTKNKISLSGTPIENSLSDLWSQMEFINPKILGSYEFFKKRFLKPMKATGNGSSIHELKEIIRPFILRRTKEEVALDLPELTETVYYCDMEDDQRAMYEKEKSAARNLILNIDGQSMQQKFMLLSSLTKLRQIANHPSLVNSEENFTSGKFQEVTDSILTIVGSGHKIILFSSFTKHLDLFEAWLEESKISFVSLTGETKMEQREKNVKIFQEDESVKIFLISIKAGGTGLNLTAADYIFILDPWWNPFVEKQAIARSHRIGRHKPVQVLRFIVKDSIEQKIQILQEEKKQLSEALIDENVMPEWIGEYLPELLA
ncbi:MAG: ATP-dependent helicase [Saprospiraceae bacterium]|nr:ATP-dependent helicase [Candidatus Vicinibacter affinis]